MLEYPTVQYQPEEPQPNCLRKFPLKQLFWGMMFKAGVSLGLIPPERVQDLWQMFLQDYATSATKALAAGRRTVKLF